MPEFTQYKPLMDMGFTLFFAVMVIILMFKFMPKLIVEWHEFTQAIKKNTEITDKHYQESMDLKQELIHLREKLLHHDLNATELRKGHEELLSNQKEMLDILKDMQDIVSGKSSNMERSDTHGRNSISIDG